MNADARTLAGQTFRPAAVPATRRDLATTMIGVSIFLLPVSNPLGPANVAPLDVPIILSIAAMIFLVRSNGWRFRAPLAIGVLTMMVAGAAAAFAGRFPGAGALAIVQDIFVFAWYLAIVNTLRTVESAKHVFRAWAAAGFGSSLLLLFAMAAGISRLVGVEAHSTRVSFTFHDQNSAGLYFTLSLFMVLATRYPKRRFLRACAVVVIAISLLLTGSLAAILGTAVGLGVAVLALIWKRSGPEAAIAFSALGIVAVAAAGLVAGQMHVVQRAQGSKYTVLRDSIGRGHDSSSERETLAKETSGLLLGSGLLGRGPASTVLTLRHIQAPYPKEAHDDFIATVVERGLFGVIGLALFIASLIAMSRTLVGRRLSAAWSEVLPAAPFLLGAVASLVIFALTHEILHERMLWALLGMVAATYAWGRDGASREARS